MILIPDNIKEFVKASYSYLLKDGYRFEGLFPYLGKDKPYYYKARFKNYQTGAKHCPFIHESIDGKIIKLKPKFESGDPLYNEPLLESASEVWIVEGELKADKLSALGCVVTTTGGSKTLNSANWRPLANKSIIIWPDIGPEAAEYVQTIAKHLLPLGCTLMQVDTSKLQLVNRQDCADWIAANPLKTLKDVPLCDIPATNIIKTNKFNKISAQALLETTFPEREKYLPWLLKQSVNMIHAWRGTGKTHMAFGIAHALATQGSFLGWQASKQVRVIYIDGELAVTELQARMRTIIDSSDSKTVPEALEFITPDLQPSGMPNLASVEGQEQIDALLKETEVIIVDNLSCLVRGDAKENDADSWNLVQEWALKHKKEGRTIIFIHHSGKSGGQRGTSKREDIMDTVMKLTTPPGYNDENGACFEVRFEKKRNMLGKDAVPFTAKLVMQTANTHKWEVETIEETLKEQVWNLEDQGYSNKEIVEALKTTRGTVSKYLGQRKKVRESERVPDDMF